MSAPHVPYARQQVRISQTAASFSRFCLLFETGVPVVTGPLMIAYRQAHPSIGVPQILLFPLCQIRILKRSENVIEFRFKLLKFCTEHVDLPLPWRACVKAYPPTFAPAGFGQFISYAAHLARSSFFPKPRMPCFWPTFLKAAIAVSK